MKKVKNQVLYLILVKFRKKRFNKLFKAKNPDLYYKNLYIDVITSISNVTIILRLLKPRFIFACFL